MPVPAYRKTSLPLSTGLAVLDYKLQGGYPRGAVTVLAGHLHAIKTIAAYARSAAHRRRLNVGYLRALGLTNDPMFPAKLWSTVTMLLQQSVDLLVLEDITPHQMAAMPETIADVLARRNRTLLITLTDAVPCRAALRLHCTPGGWLYRRRRLYGYRVRVSWRPRRRHTVQRGMNLRISAPPLMVIHP